jgi:muramoyltetrapeptide carboxypeptidase
VGEDPYRIDRWLTGFLLSGKLAGLAGVALGKFSKCAPGDFRPSFGGLGTWTWQEVCADRFGKLGVPVVAGLCFGHVKENATIPLGAMAELDAEAGTLSLLEPAVR